MKSGNEHIFILKTNIRTLCENCDLHKMLDQHSEITQWTIDFEDVDKVLRVVTESLTAASIIDIVHQYGFDCSEL